jgi:hypothetical protein
LDTLLIITLLLLFALTTELSRIGTTELTMTFEVIE